MTRGHLAPLSSHEEVTLRRLALGISRPASLSTRDVERLRALCLVEQHPDGLRLTPAGRERYLTLPKSVAVDPADTADDVLSKLAEFMTRARG